MARGGGGGARGPRVIRSPGLIGVRVRARFVSLAFLSWPLGPRRGTITRWIMSLSRGADRVFLPVDTDARAITFAIKILKRDKKLVNRCTVNE